ncbi:MAG: hypothetical protein ABSH16_13510 [Sedimentisphaerales bacterium]
MTSSVPISIQLNATPRSVSLLCCGAFWSLEYDDSSFCEADPAQIPSRGNNPGISRSNNADNLSNLTTAPF